MVDIGLELDEINEALKLAEKYNLQAENDADLLLKLLDKFSISKLDELDGVYAFVYHKDDQLFLKHAENTDKKP